MKNPYLLSIAGFDPSAGAGAHADIKTFNSLDCYGLSSLTSLTIQTEDSFTKTKWLSFNEIKEQAEVLINRYNPQFCKIGLTGQVSTLTKLCKWLKEKNPQIFILWDPILESSSSEIFYNKNSFEELITNLQNIDLITPNAKEARLLSEEENLEKAGKRLAQDCFCLITGCSDKNLSNNIYDVLFDKEQTNSTERSFTSQKKHGSGCVFSASLLAYLAKNNSNNSFESILHSSKKAGDYTFDFLNSSGTLLGFQHNP